jgi:hypothetical protein
LATVIVLHILQNLTRKKGFEKLPHQKILTSERHFSRSNRNLWFGDFCLERGMVDSATRLSTMTRILAENTLAISHIRDSAEVARRLEEAKANHQGLVLRRLVFNPTICTALQKTLGTKKCWKKVELRNVDGDVTAAISTCMAVVDAMEELQLVINNTEIEEEGWSALAVGLQLHSKLTRLRITTALDAPGMRALSEGLKDPRTSLKTLDFSWSTLEDDETVQELALGLGENKSLHELHFMGCSLRDPRVAQLAEALREHPCLKCLDFNGNKSGPLASTALATLLDTNKSLEKLDVSFQTNDEPLNIQALAESLRGNSTLRTLDLSNCQLGDEDAERLFRVLCETTSLTELFVARNKISDEGVKLLARLLSEMKGLRRLSLWGNPFNDEGAKALAVGLESNFELSEIDLFRNFPCSEQIAYYTLLNRAGRGLMHNTAAPLSLWPTVLERLEKINIPNGSKITSHDLIFFLLRGPALLHSR